MTGDQTRRHLGDILGECLSDSAKMPLDATASNAAVPDFEATIRTCAHALGEDPAKLVALARGRSALARAIRLLLREPEERPRLSSDQEIFILYEKLRRAGFKGTALWNELARLAPRRIEPESAQKAVYRYRKHLAKIPPANSIEALFSPEYQTDKRRGRPGPKHGGPDKNSTQR